MSTESAPMLFDLQTPSPLRIEWEGRNFSATAYYGFAVTPKNQAELVACANEVLVTLECRELAKDFRNKLLHALGAPQAAEAAAQAQHPDLVVSFKLAPESGNYTFYAAEPAFSAGEKESFTLAARKALAAEQLGALREFIGSFHPDFAQWRNALLQRKKADESLIGARQLLPGSLPFLAEVKGEEWEMEDLYCVNQKCPCTDVTCLLFRFDPESGQQVLWGGFRYDVANGKFKPAKHVPDAKFNAQEVFKRFSQNFPLPLELLLPARFKNMRYRAAHAHEAPPPPSPGA